ncbi:hypothetical protein [Conexibacter arvalis]|uniref:Auto-transporter adhesin head GIN domain-containing protein n=1 Tax=Conexibacter arvalis TaxID=912552 RepID=A0A840IJ26_9ACTN|nr:hypothetical protein [Conexibacter arvalis]MBB4664749.1 hypothetical protein [Conexibacter arvalis]
MKRSRIILAGALAATLALPAAAQAAGTVSGGPVKVAGGYSVMLSAVDAKRDSLTIVVDRGTVANGQMDTLHVTRGVRVVVRPGKATIKGAFGRRGDVDLRLRNASADRSRKVPRGCTGKPGTTHKGALVGRLRLRLPNGKLVTIRSLPSQTSVGGSIRCDRTSDRRRGDGGDGDGGDGQDDQMRLMLTLERDGVNYSFMATKRDLTLTRAGAPERAGRATVSSATIVRAGGSNLLSASDGGARATVKGAGAFTGTGLFRSNGGGGPFATGPLTGNLRVKLQGAPLIDVAGDDAILLNGDR